MASIREKRRHDRPKACDLCFGKKIKCDMLKPKCSNCLLYRTECQVSIARSRAKPPRPKPANADKKETRGSKSSENIQVRMHSLEEKLQEVLESTRMAQTSSSATASAETDSSPERVPSSFARGHKWNFDPAQPSLYYGPSDEDPILPQLPDIVPIIDLYFKTFNQAFPLFNQKSFMGLVSGWYSKHPKRGKVIWANILVVVALALQSQVSNEQSLCDGYGNNKDLLSYCLRNAQSLMPDLVARDEDLLGIQAILGLVLVFKNTSDPQPACTLAAAAVALSHRMHLHSAASSDYYRLEEVQQRSRVFWILYMLDKDLSMRTKTPPLLSDSEVDLNLPPEPCPHGTGTIGTIDGLHEMNIFRLRLDLACIEGKIFNLLFSGRARKTEKSEQRKRVASLQMMLDNWYARIPAAMRIRDAASAVNEIDLVHITNLYHTYLLCHFWINGIYSVKAEWPQKASSLSRAALNDFAIAVQGNKFPLCTQISHAPLEDGWQRCVDISRDSMALFEATKPTASMIWQSGGPHLTALVILISNILVSPGHPSASIDLMTAIESITLFDRLEDLVQSSSYEPLNRVVKNLYKDASAAIGDIQMEVLNEAVGLDSLNEMHAEMGLYTEGTEYLGLEGCRGYGVGDSTGFDGMLDPFALDFA